MRRITAFVVAFIMTALLAAPVAWAQSTRPSAAPESTARSQALSQQVDAKRALSMRMPETKLTDVRLEDAIDFLRDASGANIHVNWRALETVNITRETSVTLRMSPMPLRKLLKYVLTEADGQNLITFYPDDGVIEVTTRDVADRQLITKVYPVEDLLLVIPDFTDPPTFQLQSPQSAGSGGGGGGQSLLGSNLTEEQDDRAGKNQRGQELVQLVRDTVRPDVWRENGGNASIRYFRGRLIVTAPRSVHEQIGGAVE